MIFNYIKLNNFRQYKNEHTFVFSKPENGNITLIIAENGVGKTTLIQAFRYCFYGNLQNNKFLNLPKAEELINNTIIDELNSGEEVSLSIEIGFDHEGSNYVMRREKFYSKHNTRMIENKEDVTLSKSSSDSGYTTIGGDAANLEMMNLLPPGLSHIFMFDGERMERRIDSNDFRNELKESILGILNIKKYDKLIEYLGSDSQASTVIGKLHRKISNSSLEEAEATKKYGDYSSLVESKTSELERKKELQKELDAQINKFNKIQESIVITNARISERASIEKEIEQLEKDIKTESINLSKYALNALLKKELLSIKPKFDEFIKSSSDDEGFYQFLHADTLTEILHRRRCICGTIIEPGSPHEHSINGLFKNSLPVANAQYLSFIESDIFKQTLDYNDERSKIKEIKYKIDVNKGILQEKSSSVAMINHEIRNDEATFGVSTQLELDKVKKNRDIVISEIGRLESELDAAKHRLKIQENKCRPMWEKNDANREIILAKKDLSVVRENLKVEKSEKEKIAREVLSKFFNDNISLVMSGNYTTKISDDYRITIFDNDKNKDVTDVISTGQSVVVSLSFVKALISTASELSKEYHTDSQYGVVMDAALSNLDEYHTSKLSEFNLNTMDQLIFLSFKRQLRDEMYSSIQNNIGIAYEIKKIDNDVDANEIPLEQLSDYIHEIVGENND